MAEIIVPNSALMTKNHRRGCGFKSGSYGAFSETACEGVLGLGFPQHWAVAPGTVGAGDYHWGGAASTIFG